MVIKKEHAILLKKLLKDQEENKPCTEITEDELNTIYELERAGLVRQQTPVRWILTYSGEALAQVLKGLYAQGEDVYSEKDEDVAGDIVIREQRGMADPEEWPDKYRWIGSEVIAMLDAAQKAGQVGPKAEQHLLQRGLAVKIWDRNRKKEYSILSEAGQTVLDIYKHAHPRLLIDDELAEFIRKSGSGPATSDRLPTGSHEEHLLEAMRLIAYSVPVSDAYAFTALGQAIKKTLSVGGFVKGTVISEDILFSLAQLADGEEVPEEAVLKLQELGFVDSEKELIEAGFWALESFRLWYDGPREGVWTIAISENEIEVLQTTDMLVNRFKETRSETELPNFENIKRRMIDKKIEQYKKLLEKYGRRINEMPLKYRKIAEEFEKAKDLKQWYEDNFMLREELYSLESFNLIRSVEDDKGKEIFEITNHGKKVLEDQKINTRNISSTAVKSITMTRKMFSAPSMEWIEEAKEQNLIGTAEPTKSGMMYAGMAETIERLPLLTRFEMEIFKNIPARGITEEEIYEKLAKDEKEKFLVKWALEKLEARRLIEVLPDGNVVETKAGELLDEALSGVPNGIANPVNPILVRMLKALRAVGTLYVKEKKVRILPGNFKKALKLSGLSEEAFNDAIMIARLAGYIGKNSITTSGLLLLEVADSILAKPEDNLDTYIE